MRTNFLFVLSIVFLAFACETKQTSSEKTVEASTEKVEVLTIENLEPQFEALVDKEVTFTGNVKHVCKHSGKRAFIESDNGKVSIRVEAKGDIKSFGGELIGEELLIKGTVREKRIDEAYLQNWEEQIDKAKAKQGDVKQAEQKVDESSCQSGNSTTQAIRAEIAASGKGYKSVYYVDGLSYAINGNEEK